MQQKRIFFTKLSPAVYYSHLDLMRCFERAFRRASIPIWYTEGFNPRPFLSFAQPLSLGSSGSCEVLDIRLEKDMTDTALVLAINSALPEGVKALKSAEPIHKANEISYAEYTLKFTCDACSGEFLSDMLDNFLGGERIDAVKQNKRKQRVTIDIKPFISYYSITHNETEALLNCVLACGSERNLSPSLLASAFGESIEEKPVFAEIRREHFLLSDKSLFE